MLQIKNIRKVYETEDLKQVALDKVSINFRKSEFVSILGPSGSGKTTLLNIIGGLDKYDSGDLIINNISTKKYNDRDWDSYRNHRVGFVFQSYNLISHQTVLKNVELALTLSGVSKNERTKLAKKALANVGLEKHINKKPSQLSGGQMQRVAIARALINNPDIILADEPTGALDTHTSKQIMDLLRKVSKDKLVIMVTHNPELANEYSSRIIKLQDGKIIDDTDPFNNKEKEEIINKNQDKKTSMNFLTAISLSFNNLLTKKGRTILTAFAGSIGIIGIALILSLSNGFQKYIDKLQEDTLNSYPLSIQKESMDFSSFLMSMMEQTEPADVEKGKIKESQQFASMFSNLTTNDLKSFKKYLEDNDDKIKEDVKSISYVYSVDPLIMTKNDNEILTVNPNSIFSSMYGNSSLMSTFSSNSSVFFQLDEDKEYLEENYTLLKGKYPEKYNEMILILPNENTISDLVLYLIGIRDMDELYDIMSKVMSGEPVNINNEPMEFDYDDFLNLSFKLINKPDLYKYNSKFNIYEDMLEDEKYVKKVYDKSTDLKIVGIVYPNDSSTATNNGIGYRSDLIKHVINEAGKSKIVKKQLEEEDIDVFSNTKFENLKNKPNMNFDDLISIDKKKLEKAFDIKIDENDIKELTSNYMNEISDSITTDITPAKDALTTSMNTLSNSLLKSLNNKQISMNEVDSYIETFINSSEANNIYSSLEDEYIVPSDVYKTAFKSLLNGLLKTYISAYYMYDQTLTSDANNLVATYNESIANATLSNFNNQAAIITTIETISRKMTEAKMQKTILTKVGELTSELVGKIASSFNVNPNDIASAFKFNLDESELKRLMSAMSGDKNDKNANSNLINLGYQDVDEPTAINVRFYSFDAKQNFLDFIKNYNEQVKEEGEEEKEINYTDATGILMSSVKKIVDSVSYVLIAFVSIALIVSSIMIGIITYISVLERTKEIGILRAIGASKHNISSIFNAETFIIGLLSGIIGIGVTCLMIIPINMIIHSVTNNPDISAILPISGAIVLIILSVLLTIIGGLIPSKIASKKDPVEALRSE